MFVLGLQGSPRRRANTHHLLSSYLAAAAELGARTETVEVTRRRISPCIGCGQCETKGVCVHRDDMSADIYTLLRQADAVVLATPIYFYNATAQLKTLIDRSQTLWSRRYRLKLTDPGAGSRRGAWLSLAATRGKGLFDGLDLTAQYFFDAISADGCESLAYRQIEHPGDLKRHPTVAQDVARSAAALLAPFIERKTILFLGGANDGASQMAAAFARHIGGARLNAVTGGRSPADRIAAEVHEIMAETGLDLGFLPPRSVASVLSEAPPDLIIDLGSGEPVAAPANIETVHWALPPIDRSDRNALRQMRDDLQERVAQLAAGI
jgi:arsenate reductase